MVRQDLDKSCRSLPVLDQRKGLTKSDSFQAPMAPKSDPNWEMLSTTISDRFDGSFKRLSKSPGDQVYLGIIRRALQKVTGHEAVCANRVTQAITTAGETPPDSTGTL